MTASVRGDDNHVPGRARVHRAIRRLLEASLPVRAEASRGWQELFGVTLKFSCSSDLVLDPTDEHYF